MKRVGKLAQYNIILWNFSVSTNDFVRGILETIILLICTFLKQDDIVFILDFLQMKINKLIELLLFLWIKSMLTCLEKSMF